MDKLFENLLPRENVFLFDLHVAASIGCEESAREIIENVESKDIINRYNISGWTPLMYAACSTNLKVLSFLLEERAQTDLPNHFGQTALILASKCGSTDAVSLLLDFGANINLFDSKAWSAAFYASAYGHRSVLQLLIEKGALIDVVDKKDGYNPLMLSAAAGHEMIVKDLLLLGLDPLFESKSGDTARSLAVKYGHHNVKNLIDTYSQPKRIYSNIAPKVHSSQSDLLTLLKELQLSKYYPIFESQGIDLNTFWMLSDEDFKELGINLLGPRKKMCLAISKHHSECAKWSCEEKDLISRLSLENKHLLQQIGKVEAELSQEIELKKIAERNLSDGILTLKNFTDNVQRTVRYTLVLGEKLRQGHSNLKKIIFCAHDINKDSFKRDILFPLLDGNEKLIEDIHHQILLSLQQTDFSH